VRVITKFPGVLRDLADFAIRSPNPYRVREEIQEISAPKIMYRKPSPIATPESYRLTGESIIITPG
jgi:hypothetical protein